MTATPPAPKATQTTPSNAGPARAEPQMWPVYTVIALCVVIELALILGDAGWLGTVRLRATAYEYLGFWPGLLGPWRPNYAAQPYTMFLTYSLLHGGLTHLVVNMVTLWSLGHAVSDRVGARGFVALYVASILGGALCFGLLAKNTTPMVGASGGLFGLIGGYLAWNYVDRFVTTRRLWPVWRAVGLLVVLNLVMWWAMGGLLAWQTHLGGFLAGWVAAMVIDPRARPDLVADPAPGDQPETADDPAPQDAPHPAAQEAGKSPPQVRQNSATGMAGSGQDKKS